jgi:hypothetical protein
MSIKGNIESYVELRGSMKFPDAIKGDKGDPFKYEDFTPEQLANLKGEQGEPFKYEDFTPEQLAKLKGETGSVGMHIGTEAPTDGQVAWIDLDEGPSDDATTGIDVVATPGQVIAVEAVDAYSKPTKFKAVDLPKATTPDLSANEGEDGYIKGRTHYIDEKGVVHKLPNKFIDADWMATSEEGGGKVVFIPEQTVSGSMWSDLKADLVEGDAYAVEVNGVLYKCVCLNDGDGTLYLGNGTLLGATGGNGEPFAITWFSGATGGAFYTDGTLAEPIGIKVTDWQDTVYNKLPEEFLPDNVVKGEGGKVHWDNVTGKPFAEDTGELLFSKTVTFDSDNASKKITGVSLSLVEGAEYWLEVNGDMIKCHCENAGYGILELHDSAGNRWLRVTGTVFYVYGQTAGTYTYNLYEIAENIVLDPQYIPNSVARKSDIPDVSGMVKSVNGNTPDENGNVTVEIPESTGGGADIDVTATVGQTIIVKEVDENGKPTKWESADYQPRTHWRERANVVPEAEGMYDEGAFVVECGDFAFEVFKEYIITINGTEYTTVAQGDIDGNVWVGNPILMGGEDDGTPFALMTMDGILFIALFDGQTSLTISVDIWKYTKIPSEYVNAGAFYIDVSHGYNGDGAATTTTTTYNEVENAWIAGVPMIVRINDDYAICAHVSRGPDANSAMKFLGYTDNFDQVQVTLEADGTADDYKTAPLIVNLTIMD